MSYQTTMIYPQKRQRELRDPQGTGLDLGPSIRMCGYSSCVVLQYEKPVRKYHKGLSRVRSRPSPFPFELGPDCLGQLRALDSVVEGCSAVKTVSKLDAFTGLRTLGLNGGWIFFCASRCQS